MNKRILITGATGNIGKEIVPFLDSRQNKIIAGVRNPSTVNPAFKSYKSIEFHEFDIERPETFPKAFKGIDTIFLLRPPQISNVKKYFYPLVREIKDSGIREIVFLSVQGADKSRVIPHYKIEKLILEEDLDYIFLRPSYFMQNLSTTLYQEIKNNNRIFIPAGNAKFNWIDAKDIGKLAARVLMEFKSFKNSVFDITGQENLSFKEVVKRINTRLSTDLQYISPAPLPFFLYEKRKGSSTAYILVQIMLHYLPRFSKVPVISDSFKDITGDLPNSIEDFIEREKNLLTLQ